MKIDVLNNKGECDDECPFLSGGFCLLFKEDLREVWKIGINSANFVASWKCNDVVEKQKRIMITID